MFLNYTVAKIYQHSRRIEDEYLERECLLDGFDELIINLEDTSSDESDLEFDHDDLCQ